MYAPLVRIVSYNRGVFSEMLTVFGFAKQDAAEMIGGKRRKLVFQTVNVQFGTRNSVGKPFNFNFGFCTYFILFELDLY